MPTASSRGPADAAAAAALGTNLTGTTAPALKKERAERRVQVDEDAEVYSDPDEGVEIVDMSSVHAMDWMAPESLKVKREHEKTKKVVKADEEGQVQVKRKGAHTSCRLDIVNGKLLTPSHQKQIKGRWQWIHYLSWMT